MVYIRTKINNCILIGSGKGGTGKSSLSCLIALSLHYKGFKTAIYDGDLAGPSIPKILDVHDKITGGPIEGILPSKNKDGLMVFSDELFMNNKSTTVLWKGDRVSKYIINTLENINWGKELDFLVIDLPPSTLDSPQSTIQFMKDHKIKSGQIFVSSPQDVSLNDISKAISMCHKLQMPIIGMIENFRGFTCPHCKKDTSIFGDGKVKDMCQRENINYLGYLPINMELSSISDKGLNLNNIPEEIKPYLLNIVNNILVYYKE